MGRGKVPIPPLYAGLIAASLLGYAGVLGSATADPPAKKTLGLAITSWTTSLYETEGGKEECPDGLNEGGDQIWLKTLTPEQRDKATKHGTLDAVFLRD